MERYGCFKVSSGTASMKISTAMIVTCLVGTYPPLCPMPAFAQEGRSQIILAAADAELLPDASAYIARAAERLKRDNFDPDRAITDLDAAIALEPDNSAAYQRRAMAWMAKREFDRAIADLDKTIALDPANATAYRLRGNMFSSRSEFDRAIADMDQAVTIKPRDPHNYFMRAIVWIARSHEKAIEDFSRAIELNPNFSQAYVQRGQLYSYGNQAERAKQDYTQAIETDPNNSYAYQKRGEMWAAEGNLDRAIEDYERAAKTDPGNVLKKQILDAAIRYKQTLPELQKMLQR